MITKEMLMKLNKKEIESLFNSCLAGFNKTSIEQSEVKQYMFEHLKKQFTGVKINYIDYHYNAFRVEIGNIAITVKTGVKSTGEVVKVTKLRSKLVKGKGKFKIDYIEHGISHLCYKFSDEKSWKIKIEKGYSSSGDPSSVNLTDFDLPLKDMSNVDFLLNAIDTHETNNTYRTRTWKGFRKELEISIAQPVIKKIYFKLKLGVEFAKKSELKEFPEPYYSKLPERVSMDELFNLMVDTVADINIDLINDVINNKTFILD